MNFKNVAEDSSPCIEGPPRYLGKHVRYLEERIRHLEEVNRFTLDALEMAASLGDFQSSINKQDDIPIILTETRSRINRLLKLKAVAFYLADEETSDFTLADIEPELFRRPVRNEVDSLIENGTFGWTLKEKRPVIVSTEKHETQLILHVMATSSRIRGMFVGLMEKDKNNIQDISLSLLSIILLNASNALESLELYRMIREINENLDRRKNYKILFEAAPDGVEVLDARGHIVDCNKTYQILLGREIEDIVGKHASDFFSIDGRELLHRQYAELKEIGYVESEVELVHRNGRRVPVWRKEKAIYDENGNFVGSVIYNRDLSHQKKAEEEKRNLEVRLHRARKMEALGTLAGGVAHDLNNMLGSIIGYPDLLLMQIPEDSPLRKPLLTIQKSGEKAAAIVQDLLTLGRRGVVVPEPVDLNVVLTDYLKSLVFAKLKSFNPNVRFETRLERNLLNILGSPVHLSKTIMNLVSNAAEAMPQGGEVLISTEGIYIDRPIGGYDHVEKGDYVLLTVSDGGIGIPAQEVERIFEPFYTKKALGRSGTGLGMTVVWGTVKDHNGYIDVQSSDGRGTSFKLYFPVTSQEPKRELAGTRPLESYKGHQESILVVDDVEEQRNLACHVISELG
jgi:PAS domain S-box-containing protein